MDPWFCELVRTLAAVAVEDALARDERKAITVSVGDVPLHPGATRDISEDGQEATTRELPLIFGGVSRHR
jgi:hypothetical protein